MSTAPGKVRNETAARRIASTVALLGSILCSDAEATVAAAPTDNSPVAVGEPVSEASDAHAASAGGVPRVLVYGAVAGLFLLVAAGLGAHKKH